MSKSIDEYLLLINMLQKMGNVMWKFVFREFCHVFHSRMNQVEVTADLDADGHEMLQLYSTQRKKKVNNN